MISEFYTITAPTEAFLHKEKKSKFWGFAMPLQNEQELKEFITALKIKYPQANHFCYAWQIGISPSQHRFSDDGEPNNTAGAPIYGQIQSNELSNVAVVVLRIFGGVKLGTGGLITAYRAAAHGAIKAAAICKMSVQKEYLLKFPYAQLHHVMRLIKKNELLVKGQKIANQCEVSLKVDLIKEADFLNAVAALRDCEIL